MRMKASDSEVFEHDMKNIPRGQKVFLMQSSRRELKA